MIKYSETYAVVTPESAINGDFSETGFIDENLNSDFRDMIDLLQGTEPNCSDINQATWFTAYNTNVGTIEYYETGAEESRSYHPKSERDLRYMIKAWKAGN